MFDEVSTGIAEGHTCESNMAEFYYKTCERFGREAAEVRYTSLRHSRISILTIGERLTRIAGGLKCTHRGELSLTDAYIVAAAKMTGGKLITTDPRITELKLVKTKLLQVP